MSHSDPFLAQIERFKAAFTPNADGRRIAGDFAKKTFNDFQRAELRNIELLTEVDSAPGTLLHYTRGLSIMFLRDQLESLALLLAGKSFIDLDAAFRKTIVEAHLGMLSDLFLEYAEKGRDFKAERGS